MVKTVSLSWCLIGSVMGRRKLVGLSTYTLAMFVMWVLRVSCLGGLLRCRSFHPVFAAHAAILHG